MATATVEAKSIEQSPPEQRVHLTHVSWATYASLLADQTDISVPRMAYNQGALEIVAPSFEHERINRAMASLIDIVCDERAIEFVAAGSMTYKREDIERGFEPDSSYYLQNAARVFSIKRIDESTDPPPDLVIEIDMSSTSMNKLPIYAAMGVPEIWRYENGHITIFRLDADGYRATPDSHALPPSPALPFPALSPRAFSSHAPIGDGRCWNGFMRRTMRQPRLTTSSDAQRQVRHRRGNRGTIASGRWTTRRRGGVVPFRRGPSKG